MGKPPAVSVVLRFLTPSFYRFRDACAMVRLVCSKDKIDKKWKNILLVMPKNAPL